LVHHERGNDHFSSRGLGKASHRACGEHHTAVALFAVRRSFFGPSPAVFSATAPGNSTSDYRLPTIADLR
jgi:hypothetical protein